jgi:hypothetical protein
MLQPHSLMLSNSDSSLYNDSFIELVEYLEKKTFDFYGRNNNITNCYPPKKVSLSADVKKKISATTKFGENL